MAESKRMKNGLLVVAVLVVMAALVGGDLLWSYWQGMQGMVRSGLRDATSIEFDLARLDQAIEALTPVLQENKRTAAELEVEIEYLEADTRKIEQRQELARAEMRELRQVLDGPCDRLRIDGRIYSRVKVEADLLRRLQAYEQTAEHLQTRRNMIDKRHEQLRRAIGSITETEQQQQLLAQMADSLNAEWRIQQAASDSNGFALEQPNVADVQRLAMDIQKHVRASEKLSQQLFELPVEVNLDRRTAAERYDAVFADDEG